MNIRTEIFIVPLLGKFLVYAPLRRVAFITDSAGTKFLENLRRSETPRLDRQHEPFMDFLRAIHVLGDEGDLPISTFENRTFKPTEVTLFLTSRCNLRCIYCYALAGDRPASEMSLITAMRGIEYVWRNTIEKGKTEFTVGYHGGGEPTMNWEVLKESFEYAKRLARSTGMQAHGYMATNGVLSYEKRQWIANHFCGVNVSIDGLPDVQNIQRPMRSGRQSSNEVLETVRFFDNVQFRYGIRMTVTALSLERLPQSVAYLLESTRPTHIQVEPMYLLGRGKDIGMAVEPLAFVQAFMEARSIARQCNVDMFYSAARMDVLTDHFCQSCGEGFNLTPQGFVSSCYEVPGPEFEFADEFIFGRYNHDSRRFEFDEEKVIRLRDRSIEPIAWCDKCFCKWHCAGDCFYKKKHRSVEHDFAGDPRCEITRLLTLQQILEKIGQNGGKVWVEGYHTEALRRIEAQYKMRDRRKSNEDQQTRRIIR